MEGDKNESSGSKVFINFMEIIATVYLHNLPLLYCNQHWKLFITKVGRGREIGNMKFSMIPRSHSG